VLLAELGVKRSFLVAAPAGRQGVRLTGVWTEIPSGPHPGGRRARRRGADGILAVGGGSAIDLAKAISAETGLPLVSVPTTYSGAEWTPSFGSATRRRMRGGGSARSSPESSTTRSSRSACRGARPSAPR
jgi:hypothetical protein